MSGAGSVEVVSVTRRPSAVERASVAGGVLRVSNRVSDARSVVGQQPDDRLVAFGHLVLARRLQGAETERVEKRLVALRRGPGAGQEDRVAALDDRLGARGARAAQRRARIAVAVLGAPIPQLARGSAVGLSSTQVRVQRRVRSDSEYERHAGVRPGQAAEAVLGARQLGRLALERRRQRADPIALRHLRLRVAAVERLDPGQRRRLERLPPEAPRAGQDAAVGHVVGHRKGGDRPGDRADAVPHLDAAWRNRRTAPAASRACSAA